jgi:hypothetical protein
VAVIKSLAISQLTFLLSVLPNPPESFFKKVEKIFLNFIWSGKQDKIKRDTMYNKIEDGGLNMTNIYLFKDAIKISWVKRFIDPVNRGKWKLLFAKGLQKIGGEWLWQCEPSTVSDLNLSNINNAFLGDVLIAWFKLCVKYEVTNKVIWYNSKIKIDHKCVFYRSWSSDGINFLSDLIENNHLMTFEGFRKKHPKVKCNFIQYYGITKNIKNNCNSQCNKLFADVNKIEVNDRLLTDIISAQKICKFAYQKLRQQTSPTSQTTWNAKVNKEFSSTQPIDWKGVYTMAFVSSIDTYTRYFQFRYIHNILPTNYFLYKIGFTKTDKCTLCKNVVETIKHLMWDCDISKKFCDFTKWIKKDLSLFIDLNFEIICFGLLEENFDRLKNMLLLLGKQYIYRCRVEEKPLSIFVFKEWIKNVEKSERLIAIRNNKLWKQQKMGHLGT